MPSPFSSRADPETGLIWKHPAFSYCMHKTMTSSESTLPVPGAANTPECPLYPDIADVSHATPALVEFLRHYFQTKSRHDADAFVKVFDTARITYIDTVLGLHLSAVNFEGTTRSIMASWPADAKSYPLRIIGDADSAVMFFEDTPTMFGTKLRGIAALDMEDGKVVRQVDY